MTPEYHLRLIDDFTADVYTLLANKSVGSPETRVVQSAELLDAWFVNIHVCPPSDMLERLADYILFDEPNMLTESQINRRFIREPSTSSLSD